ncbi:MAG: 50S ribosomal protein L25, partial [Bacteroidota bacterium]|nr:50S ribosomal protein L25 [Bacteroidota bacterium]
MKSLEIVGFKRANLGKTDAKALRLDAQVPCVLYGGT